MLIIIKSIVLCLSIFFSVSFILMKLTSVIKLFYFKESEDAKTNKAAFKVLMLSCVLISIFYALTNF